jgi:hypothetical protein
MSQTVLQKRDFANLVSLIAAQRDAYALLLSLSKAQERVFGKGGVRSLMKIIARKQAVIDSLGQIDKSLAPYTGDWSQTLSSLPALARREIAALIGEVTETLGALVECERTIAKVVSQARDETSARIRGLGEGRTVVKAYGQPTLAGAGHLLDREG